MEGTMVRKMEKVGEALDEISWDWLEELYPGLAGAIEGEMRKGASPEEIKRFVMGRTYRWELALRCEQAARCVALRVNA